MDGSTPEVCEECGFDSRSWRVRDARTLFDALGYWWRLATDGASESMLNRRTSPGVWSPLEYGLHSSLVTGMIRVGLESILDKPCRALPPIPELASEVIEEALVLDPAQILDALQREGAALGAVADEGSLGWRNVGHLPDGTAIQAEAALMHAAHDASHHFLDVSRGLTTIGAGMSEQEGSLTQISVSGGGVPKLPVEAATIGWRGVDGDHQADRKHHGRPFQAVCLWSSEVISQFASDGHPIAPGSAGENLTVSGLDWRSLRPATRIRVGTATLEVSYPAVPCQKQARWFTDGDINRISHDHNPQSARWYAWVRQPGNVSAGDTVRVG